MATHIANQFSGLPMSDLIGGPLNAAATAQANLAAATASFINQVAFDNPNSSQVRMVDFKFKRPTSTASADGGNINYGEEEVSLSVPFISLVNTPALTIKKVDITFDMEVKETTSDKSTTDTKASMSSNARWGLFCCRGTVNISGSVSSHKENTRSTDNSAKYHVQVYAEDTGMPEGLSRVYDILQSAIAPRSVTQKPQLGSSESSSAASSATEEASTVEA